MDELTQDSVALVVFLAFMALGLATIPLDQWLDERRARQHDQAHEEVRRR